ncbi:MAG: GYF domain-containing protein [Verrucomicrobia bacterium]|nr:GYF domain-containing protein [Verrucomicrobiota bacterium]
MWYYQQGSNRMGPIDEATIRGLLTSGQISIDTLVWTTGMSSWVPLQQSSLGAGLPTPPSAVPSYPMPVQGNPNAKDRVAYILLAVLLGFGVHNFFAGYTNRGLIQLLVSILTCGLGWFPMWIWGIVEACTVTKDANGVDFK